MPDRILLVDDDASFREVITYMLEEEGFEVVSAEDGSQGLEIFRANPFPIVMTDLKMPKLGGMALLKNILTLDPEVLVIVITAFGDLATAVKAVKAGAFDFLPKPCEREYIQLTLGRAQEHARIRRELRDLKGNSDSSSKLLMVHSHSMEQLVQLADRVADSEATILIEGESGTGKELMARRIHRSSPRSNLPFVPVNCGAIPRDLLEDELFGHVRGAFTGAVSARKGKFLQADKGTIFLDEIGELPSELQTRLLRVLQEQIVDIVGSDTPVKIDVRILTATNQDLQSAVEKGRFRRDLYFRINVIPLRIPPLRERTEEILPLAKYFLRRFGGGHDWQISPEAARRLESMQWPGNVRELENLCQRVTLLSNDSVLREDLLPHRQDEKDGGFISPVSIVLPEEGISLLDVEKRIIETALVMNEYNQTKTAEFLSIPRHVLLYRLEKFGIDTKGKQ